MAITNNLNIFNCFRQYINQENIKNFGNNKAKYIETSLLLTIPLQEEQIIEKLTNGFDKNHADYSVAGNVNIFNFFFDIDLNSSKSEFNNYYNIVQKLSDILSIESLSNSQVNLEGYNIGGLNLFGNDFDPIIIHQVGNRFCYTIRRTEINPSQEYIFYNYSGHKNFYQKILYRSFKMRAPTIGGYNNPTSYLYLLGGDFKQYYYEPIDIKYHSVGIYFPRDEYWLHGTGFKTIDDNNQIIDGFVFSTATKYHSENLIRTIKIRVSQDNYNWYVEQIIDP